MADDGKKKIVVDMTINPFGEFKGKQAPEWFKARQKLVTIVKEIKVKRSMELDPRKWKKKVLEDGVYAVARYDLSIFATALNSMQKEIDKAIPPKEQKKKKFKANDKTETKEVSAALSAAETKVTKLWNKTSKAIEDKVSLALDEVASDKGDNKKAISVGKQALKVFNQIETSELFANPISRVSVTLKQLSMALGKQGADHEEAYKSTLQDLRKIEADYDFTAKSTGKVAKMFLALGEKMGKEKSADPELQSFGKSLAKGDAKKSLEELTKNIKDLGKDLDMLVNCVAKGGHEMKDINAKASKFKSDHEKKKGSAKTATDEMRSLAKEFKAIERKLK